MASGDDARLDVYDDSWAELKTLFEAIPSPHLRRIQMQRLLKLAREWDTTEVVVLQEPLMMRQARPRGSLNKSSILPASKFPSASSSQREPSAYEHVEKGKKKAGKGVKRRALGPPEASRASKKGVILSITSSSSTRSVFPANMVRVLELYKALIVMLIIVSFKGGFK